LNSCVCARIRLVLYTDSQFFLSLGVFVQKNFLDPELCLQLCSEMRSAEGNAATIFSKSTQYQVNQEIRKTSTRPVSTETSSIIEAQLQRVQSQIEQFFQTSLSGIEPLQFLLYSKGDYLRLHRDELDDPNGLTRLSRKISVVVFLNRKSDQPEPNGFCGGALVFYGLISKPEWESFGFPLSPEPGTIVAFRPNVNHEVKGVTDGERYSIVTWYH